MSSNPIWKLFLFIPGSNQNATMHRLKLSPSGFSAGSGSAELEEKLDYKLLDFPSFSPSTFLSSSSIACFQVAHHNYYRVVFLSKFMTSCRLSLSLHARAYREMILFFCEFVLSLVGRDKNGSSQSATLRPTSKPSRVER